MKALRIGLSTSVIFPPDDRRLFEGICHDKKRDEQVALDNTEQDKSECEPKFD